MRLAPYLPKFAILMLGVAIGVVAAFVFRSMAMEPASAPGDNRGPAVIALEGSSAELGAKLLRRVGSHLIADDRTSSQWDGPIAFFAVPKPYGDTLCRVDIYTVAPKVARGPLSEQEKWDDELKIETKYGLWKRPHATGGNRDRACAAYRDFAHLIKEISPSSVERGAFLLDAMIADARTGKAPYKFSCVLVTADSGATPANCDTLAMLRALSFKDIYWTEMKSEAKTAHSYVRRDEMAVDAQGMAKALKTNRPLIATLTVDDEQHIGRQSVDQADVLSVAIEISEVD